MFGLVRRMVRPPVVTLDLHTTSPRRTGDSDKTESYQERKEAGRDQHTIAGASKIFSGQGSTRFLTTSPNYTETGGCFMPTKSDGTSKYTSKQERKAESTAEGTKAGRFGKRGRKAGLGDR